MTPTRTPRNCGCCLACCAEPAWPWPAPRLSYANAIAEAIIVAGWKLGRDRVLRNGLRMLRWLLTGETRDGYLSVVPAGG